MGGALVGGLIKPAIVTQLRCLFFLEKKKKRERKKRKGKKERKKVEIVRTVVEILDERGVISPLAWPLFLLS